MNSKQHEIKLIIILFNKLKFALMYVQKTILQVSFPFIMSSMFKFNHE